MWRVDINVRDDWKEQNTIAMHQSLRVISCFREDIFLGCSMQTFLAKNNLDLWVIQSPADINCFN